MTRRLAAVTLVAMTAVASVEAALPAATMDQLAAEVLQELEGGGRVDPGPPADFVFEEAPPAEEASPKAAAPAPSVPAPAPAAPGPAPVAPAATRASAPPTPAPVASAPAAPPELTLGPRHVWFAGTSGPLRYGRGVLLRPAEGELAPRLELRLQVAHRLASGEPSPVGFRVATNYLTWLKRYRLEVEKAADTTWAPLFQRLGDLADLLPVVALRREEVARMFCAGPRMRARLTVWDEAGNADRTGWLEFRVRPPSHTYEGLALLSSPTVTATREQTEIPLTGARPAELWSLYQRPRGAWTREQLAGTLLADLLLPLDSVPPLRWSRGHLGDPARLDPVWYWEGDEAAALLARPPEMPEVAAPPRPEAEPAGVPARPAARPRVRPAPPAPASTDPEGALPPWVFAGI